MDEYKLHEDMWKMWRQTQSAELKLDYYDIHFSECRDAGFAVYSMRIHRDLKVLNTVYEANWEKCKENCDNVNKLCRNFIYDVGSF